MAKIPEAELGKIARTLDLAKQEARAIERLTLTRPELSFSTRPEGFTPRLL